MRRHYIPITPPEFERYEKSQESEGKRIDDEDEEMEEVDVDGSEGPNADEIALTPEEQLGLEDAASGIDKTFAPSRLRKYGAGQPSDDEVDVSPEKAKKILRDGEVKGHELTQPQKGMFGAIAGRD